MCQSEHYVYLVIKSSQLQFMLLYLPYGEMRNAYKIWFRKPEGREYKGDLVIAGRIMLEMSVTEVGFECVNQIHLA